MNARALSAEFIGTFILVAAICGTGLFAVPFGAVVVGQALAAGFAMLMMSYALAHVSGGHFNPAVTLGLVAAGRFDSAAAIPYVLAQVSGAIVAAFLLQFILAGALSAGPVPNVTWRDFQAIANVYGSPRGFSLAAAFVTEALATAIFLVVFVGSTSRNAPAGFAPLAVGVALCVVHLFALPVTNAAVNPARSTATAVIAGGQPLSQLWLFWVAPIVGGILGGAIAAWLEDD